MAQIVVSHHAVGAFLAYLLLLVLIGVYSSRFSSQGVSEFFVGGRRMNGGGGSRIGGSDNRRNRVDIDPHFGGRIRSGRCGLGYDDGYCLAGKPHPVDGEHGTIHAGYPECGLG